MKNILSQEKSIARITCVTNLPKACKKGKKIG
jgi:hypothetical protein